jgi:hypothetical protein
MIYLLQFENTMYTEAEGVNMINVDRENVLDGGIRGFQRKTFHIKRRLNVRFSGEDGIDSGGLFREFMTLASIQLQQLPIFGGPENEKFLVLDSGSKHL